MASALKIRRDDEVVVISGKDRGKTGKVLRVDPKKQRVYVEGLNIVKRHQRPQQVRGAQRAETVGGVIEKEGPIHISNVMLIDPKDKKPTRVGVTREDGSAQARRATVRDEARLDDRWRPRHRRPPPASRRATARRSARRSSSASATRRPCRRRSSRRSPSTWASARPSRTRRSSTPPPSSSRRSPARSRTSAARASRSRSSRCARACPSALA